jgi:hypothetical protein
LGTGAIIKLDTFTFRLGGGGDQSALANSTLTIRNGIGSGGGIVGTSSNTSNLGGDSLIWTFVGGLNIIDNATYTAVLPGAPNVQANNGNYANGTLTEGTNSGSQDLAFQATFSAATPVPFEFSPALGVVGLGALWTAKKFLLKK